MHERDTLGAPTHNNQRRVIKCIFPIDIDSIRDQLLTCLEIASPARLQESAEIGGEIEGVLISQDSTLNHQMLIFEFCLELMLP